MSGFWKDYGKLCKESGEFYKKHWFGVVVMNAAAIAGTVAWYGRDQIKEQLKEKFSKKDEAESQ